MSSGGLAVITITYKAQANRKITIDIGGDHKDSTSFL